MKLSDRIRTLNGEPGADDGWAAYYRARDMIAAGERVTMLCIGDHDRATPAPILDAMDASARGGNTGYAYVRGSAALRDAIAARVSAQSGIATSADNVLVTPGGQAGLFAAMSAAIDPGEVACVVDPYYATYPATVRAVGGKMRRIKAEADRGFQLDPVTLMERSHGAQALLINTPHNPTGAVYNRQTMAGVANAAKENDLWLISDEVYSGQVHAGVHLSARALPDMAERTMVIGSMSKSHVMTGFRLGWVIAPEEVIDALSHLSNATTYGVPGFIQDAAEVALREGAEIEAETAAVYRARRDRALAALRGGGLRVSPPDGGMYVMLDVRPTGLTGDEFAMRLLDEEKIAVMPGESFGVAAAGHVRVTLTVEEEELAEALSRLSAFAKKVKS